MPLVTTPNPFKRRKDPQVQMPKVFIKDVKDIRNSLVPEVVAQTVSIYCVSVYHDESQNREIRLPLLRCVPIEGYVYNNIADRYAVLGHDSIHLGSINVAYKLKMENVGNWGMYVPMPEMVLKRYMSPDQRRMLANFKANIRQQGANVKFEYVQMLSAYPYG